VTVRALDKLKERFGEAILETHSNFGDDTARVKPSSWKEICTFLRKDPQMDFDLIVDLCAVDYPQRAETGERIEVVLHLCSLPKRARLRLKTRVGDEELNGAEIDSVTHIWPGANWFERETFDMMGVKFRGHPDLRRILMYPEFEGHPLLKDYPAARTQPLVQYRNEEEAGLPLEKIAPFREDEGMSFGRNVWNSADENN
jgi:NADH-quinone oxidoreductase subunit C